MKFRRRSRERAVQVLYSWEISRNDLLEIESYVIEENNMVDVDVPYFHVLCIGVVKNFSILDHTMQPYLSCQLNKLGYIELTILRIAVFEMLKCFDVPYKVIINEAIELAKIFGAEKSYRFINGVLDKIAVAVRVV